MTAHAFGTVFNEVVGSDDLDPTTTDDADAHADARQYEDSPVIFQAKTKQRRGVILFYTERHVRSQWYPSTFRVDNVIYNCAEQYYMHRKATAVRVDDTAPQR